MEFSHYSVLLNECIEALNIALTASMWTAQPAAPDIPGRSPNA